MTNIRAILKKELRSYFYSPIAYVVITIFMALSGYFFYSGFAWFSLVSFQSLSNPYQSAALNLTDMVLNPLFSNMGIILLLIMPLLTMRLFSEEKKTGTIELLLTYPIKDSEALLGKFFACFIIYILMLVLSFLYPVLMILYGRLEWGPLVSGYLGLLLMGSAYISLGILASSLTENQIVSAVLSFGALLFFWVIGWSSEFAGKTMGKILPKLSLTEHFNSFSKGLIETQDVVYYLLFILFFLFLTLRTLEAHRWRG